MLKFFEISKSTYFYNINNYENPDVDLELKNLIKEIFNKHKSRYGYRRITLELRNKGLVINHKRVKRLMSQLGLYGLTPKAKYKSYKGEVGKTANNKLLVKVVDEVKHTTTMKRNFKTTKVNEVWLSDVTEFHIPAGKLYLSPILDLHNREIVSFNISKSPSFIQTRDMLNKAFDKYNNLEGLIFHTDQGWQYQMYQFIKSLKDKNIIQSMSRKGNCLDNSPMENFFGKLKNEMFYGNEYKFKTLNQLELAIKEYIHYYNNERITVKLKGLTPVQFRNQSFN
jgi:transposase InsO family protein